MNRRQIKTAAEQDALTRWRRIYCYLQRPGVVSGIKRQARRRERREAKSAIRRDQD